MRKLAVKNDTDVFTTEPFVDIGDIGTCSDVSCTGDTASSELIAEASIEDDDAIE